MAHAIQLPEARTGPNSRGAETSRALVKHGVPADLQEIVRKAWDSRLLPQHIKGVEQAIVIALKGRELGLPPMQAFSSIHVIQGIPTLSASLMLGIAYRRVPTFALKVIERTQKVCVLEGQRSKDHPWIRVSYSWEEAEAAGLTGKDNWRKNPADMLCARASARLVRLVCPDTFCGLYAPEEVEDGTIPEEPVQPVEVTVTSAEPVAAPQPETPKPDADPFDRAKCLRSVGALLKDEAAKGEIKKAAEALGYNGKAPRDLDDVQLVALCAKVGGPLAQYAPPADPDAIPF